jgi:predicted GIY-YIG superfamily endonuclease
VKVKGFYVLEHKPTGQVYTGTSMDAEKEVKDLLESLNEKTCKVKRLVGLHRLDPDFKYRVTPFSAMPDAKAFEKKFRAHIPQCLLIN